MKISKLFTDQIVFCSSVWLQGMHRHNKHILIYIIEQCLHCHPSSKLVEQYNIALFLQPSKLQEIFAAEPPSGFGDQRSLVQHCEYYTTWGIRLTPNFWKTIKISLITVFEKRRCHNSMGMSVVPGKTNSEWRLRYGYFYNLSWHIWIVASFVKNLSPKYCIHFSKTFSRKLHIVTYVK